MLTHPGKPSYRFGHIDSVDEEWVRGWAVDLTAKGEPASLILILDDQIVQAFRCTTARPDLNQRDLPGDRLGFQIELPAFVVDGRPHQLQIRFRSGETLTYFVNGVTQDKVSVLLHPTRVHGQVDGLSGSSVRGWAFRSRRLAKERTGGVTVEVRANGVKIGQTKADLIRNDVAEVHGCEPHCGFLYRLPHRFRDGRRFALEFLAAPEGSALQGSPFTGTVLTRDNVDQLFEMHSRVEQLCTQVYALKDQLRQMTAADEYTLDMYHTWAVSYYEALRARVIAERGSARYRTLFGATAPTISVICPVYKPNLSEFMAAVDSVRNQTWANWELIIVDDGSKSAELTAAINTLCKADRRVRSVPSSQNGGISAATNAGIAAAGGDWIALFDHDDLMVDVALEVMLMAALNTGAKVLYSDEDKVDQFGLFSEPHLKTDWNYRLLLTNNYVCHLTLMDKSLLQQVGLLRSSYDGAQDHDLVLRLSETVPSTLIYHVPELLYHWRKSPGSTASAQSAKSYAVDAGQRAVSDHLQRRGLPATIEAPFVSTLYEVQWHFRAEPKVSILIPFKDQVEITRRCVACVMANNNYSNYEIVLIDNWSTSLATLDWLQEISKDKRVRVIRIEEDFNFSRINNLAVLQLETDYLLFLNNDVFVSQRDWLRRMVNEALVDPEVGIVGVKLIYPNDTVQHAGVVLGVGGIADHAFRYYPRSEPGYCFRAICSQDVSAVTAACMLCRADAFRAVGMFDEEQLTVAFNDVDLCLKVRRAGYRIIMTPAVVAEHHESISRGSDLAEHNLARFYSENQVMNDRWGDLIQCDPYYNPHFSHQTGMFERLSSTSLSTKRARSLFDKPAARAVLPPGSRYPEPAAVAANTSKPRTVEQRGRMKSKSVDRQTFVG